MVITEGQRCQLIASAHQDETPVMFNWFVCKELAQTAATTSHLEDGEDESQVTVPGYFSNCVFAVKQT